MIGRWFGCLAAALILAGCAGKKADSSVAEEAPAVVAGSESIRLAARAAYVPAAGVTRAEVEAILGKPLHQSVTKDGLPQAMYELQRARYRSVVYTEKGTVAYCVPSVPLTPIALEYEE